jgi:cytochrome b6-f complex iron-sulfur subunit
MLHAAAALRGGRPGADLPTPEFVAALESRLRTAATEPAPASSLARRRFLQASGIAAAAAAIGFGTDRLIGRHDETPVPPRGSTAELVPRNATWTAVTTVAEVHAKGAVLFSVGPVQGYVLRDTTGAITALSAICTHMGCRLEPDPTNSRLTCPCHPASFAADGTPYYAEYTAPLPRIRSRVNGESVEVLA